jgi:hypothetical protein
MPPAAMPSRPRSSPTAEEAAAIAAALERFARETAPDLSPAGAGLDAWTLAARLEGVARAERAAVPHPWTNT